MKWAVIAIYLLIGWLFAWSITRNDPGWQNRNLNTHQENVGFNLLYSASVILWPLMAVFFLYLLMDERRRHGKNRKRV